MYAIYDGKTGKWLNMPYSKGALHWCATPKIYDDYDKAKRSFASFKSQQKRYLSWKNIDEDFSQVKIVEVTITVKE